MPKQFNFIQALTDAESRVLAASKLISNTHAASQEIKFALQSLGECLKFVEDVKTQVTLQNNRKLRRKELLAQSHLGQVVLKGER